MWRRAIIVCFFISVVHSLLKPTLSLSATDESKEAVAGAFYSTICSKFFPVSEPSSAAIVGVSLRSTVSIFTPMHIMHIHPVDLSCAICASSQLISCLDPRLTWYSMNPLKIIAGINASSVIRICLEGENFYFGFVLNTS
jgi:hypothetical protein